MIKFTCPICERHIYDRCDWAHVPTTPWSDDCCCCDQHRCVAHQVRADNAPDRPSEEIMTQRANDRAKREVERFNEKIGALNKKAKQWENLTNMALEIKEYFGRSFETADEFKTVLEDIKKQMYIKGFKDGFNNNIPAYELPDKLYFDVYSETKKEREG